MYLEIFTSQIIFKNVNIKAVRNSQSTLTEKDPSLDLKVSHPKN